MLARFVQQDTIALRLECQAAVVVHSALQEQQPAKLALKALLVPQQQLTHRYAAVPLMRYLDILLALPVQEEITVQIQPPIQQLVQRENTVHQDLQRKVIVQLPELTLTLVLLLAPIVKQAIIVRQFWDLKERSVQKDPTVQHYQLKPILAL